MNRRLTPALTGPSVPVIKYLVFDVDNTLIDFEMSLLRAEKAIADRFGIQLSEEYSQKPRK